MTHFFTHHGLPLLFVVVMVESFGIPLPGETALIAFAVLASEGHYSLAWVIGLAAAGAIVGDNLGYWLIGRLGGRALFRRWRRLAAHGHRVVPRAERLFEGLRGRPGRRPARPPPGEAAGREQALAHLVTRAPRPNAVG